MPDKELVACMRALQVLTDGLKNARKSGMNKYFNPSLAPGSVTPRMNKMMSSR